MSVSLGFHSLLLYARKPIGTYLIKVDNVPWDETDHIHFGQNSVAQDYTSLCQRLLEFVDNIPSLVVLNEANNCIKQEQAGDDSQVDPVLQACSQYECQLQKPYQLESDLSRVRWILPGNWL